MPLTASVRVCVLGVCGTPTHEGVRVEAITRCGVDCFNCNCSQFKSWRRDMSAFCIRLLAGQPDPAPQSTVRLRSATRPMQLHL